MRLAFCWAHMRRPFYEFFAATQLPLAAEVLARIRGLYAIKAESRGHPAEHRARVRHDRSRPIVEALHAWLQDHLGRVSAASDLAKAIRYAIRRWDGLGVFLDDGRVQRPCVGQVLQARDGRLRAQRRLAFKPRHGQLEHRVSAQPVGVVAVLAARSQAERAGRRQSSAGACG